ncbi:MAG: response regulator [Bacteroidetes bacterium]|nr:MAG: response regulator [Bacteroidota bacterium]
MNIHKDIRILFVEDSQTEATLLSLAFDDKGINENLFWAKRVEEAKDFLQANQNQIPALKLVLLKTDLPDESGLELLKYIRSHNQLRYLPVVVYTAEASPADIRLSYDLGANGFIQKPAEFNEFAQMMHTTIRYWVYINQI